MLTQSCVLLSKLLCKHTNSLLLGWMANTGKDKGQTCIIILADLFDITANKNQYPAAVTGTIHQ